jgi:hypothetical protein
VILSWSYRVGLCCGFLLQALQRAGVHTVIGPTDVEEPKDTVLLFCFPLQLLKTLACQPEKNHSVELLGYSPCLQLLNLASLVE